MSTLTKSWTEVASSQIYTGMYLKLYLKYNSQNITANTSSVSAELRIVCASGTSAHCYTHECSFSGSFNGSDSVGSYYHGWESNTTTTILSQTITVTHNNNTGVGSVTAGASFSASNGLSGSLNGGSWSLPTIPRNFSATPVFTITNIEETTMTFNWSTSESCNQIQFFYKVKGTDTWSSKTASAISPAAITGTATITGLNANTAYDMKINCRRSIFSSASDPTMDSNIISGEASKTYSFPFVSSVVESEFNLPAPSGSSINKTVYINNDLAREGIKVYAKLNNVNVVNNNDGYVTASISGGVTSATIPLSIIKLYSNIGEEATSGSIQYYCVYNNNTTASYEGVCKTVEANCCPVHGSDNPEVPTRTTLVYTNTTATDRTVLGGDSQYIIQNHSALQIVGPTYKACANAGTSLKQIIYTWNGVEEELGLDSNSTTTRESVSEGSNVAISMWAVDKRGYKSVVSSATIKVIPYSPPKFTVTGGRTGNYESGTGSIILTAIRSPLQKDGAGDDYNAWVGYTANNHGYISYSASPSISGIGSYVDNYGTNISEYQISIGANALAPETPYTITFTYGDKLNTTLTATIKIDQAISPFDFNIQTGALGINTTVNKENMPTGLHALGLYISDSGNANLSKIESSNLTLGKVSQQTQGGQTVDVYSNVAVVGYETASAKNIKSTYIASKTGAAATETNGYFSSETTHNELINGELFVGGQDSTTPYGKIYLYNGSAYIPIIWYKNNNN